MLLSLFMPWRTFTQFWFTCVLLFSSYKPVAVQTRRKDIQTDRQTAETCVAACRIVDCTINGRSGTPDTGRQRRYSAILISLPQPVTFYYVPAMCCANRFCTQDCELVSRRCQRSTVIVSYPITTLLLCEVFCIFGSFC